MSFISGKEIEVPNKVKSILLFDEKVICGYQQAGLGGEVGGLESIFATDRRLIKLKPKNLGLRTDVEDYLYKDIANVKLNKGIVRSSINIVMRFNSEPVEIDNIPNDGSERLFKIIQDGIAGRLDGGKPIDLPGGIPTVENNVGDKIRELEQMKDSGLITGEEFQNKKKDLLDKM